MRARSGRFDVLIPSLLALGLAAGAAFAADPYENAPAYSKTVAPKTVVKPLLTVGQQIPLTGGAEGETFRFVGIPDGMGFYRQDADNHLVTLLVSHEFNSTQGGTAGPLPAGARISELTLSLLRNRAAPRTIASGKYAIEHLFYGEPPVEVDPITRGIGRLCSSHMAGPEVGFDRPIFLNGEEADGANTYDGLGGLAWATIGNETYALPRLGRAAWENIVAVPNTGDYTVVFGLEDGPSAGDGLNSQLYWYVGAKNPGAADALGLNGLDNGSLYTWVADDAAMNSEAAFATEGASLPGTWVSVDWDQTDAALDTQTRAVGGFAFVRIEDGASDLNTPGVFYFVTTGGRPANPYGRLYKMTFDAANPYGPTTLTLLDVYDTTEVISPDNIDINKFGEIAICEDPNYNLSSLGLTRDTALWIYNVNDGSKQIVAEVDRDAARAHALAADPGNSSDPGSDTPGGWEFSGVIDAESLLGPGFWLFNVQAHSLRIVPTGETVQGGQILWLRHFSDQRPQNEAELEPSVDPAEESTANVGILRGFTAEPNPSAGAFALQLDLVAASAVNVAVYDLSGRSIRQVSSDRMNAGRHSLGWDGRDGDGRQVAEGVYFVRVTAANETLERRVVIVR